MKHALPSSPGDRARTSDRPSGRAVEGAAALSPAAALAHDLRSPLSAVLGFARLAREDLASGDVARAALLIERIERSASMLDAILHSALEPSATAQAADLGSALAQIRLERKRELERRGIRLSTPDDAPPLAVRQADLYRLVGNLIGNAIDHMGAVEDAAIEVAVACRDDVAMLRVRDNGVGIPRGDCERVFDPAHTSCPGRQRSHRGLGLPIVRALAASWGGWAWIDATAPLGATVCVTIPVAR